LDGDRADLVAALEAVSAAIESVDKTTVSYSLMLNALSSLFMDRYNLDCVQADLDAAVAAKNAVTEWFD